MRHKDLPSPGDFPGAQELHKQLVRALNYMQLLSKSSPDSHSARGARLENTLQAAISVLHGQQR